MEKILSLFQESPEQYLRVLDDMLLKAKGGPGRADIDQLVDERSQARAGKNWD